MRGETSQEDAAILALLEERDKIQADLDTCRLSYAHAARQLHVHIQQNDALQAKIINLERELEKQHGTLRLEIEDLSKALAEVELYNQSSMRHDLAQLRYLFQNSEERQTELREHELLIQRIELLDRVVQKWKDEAFGRANRAVSTCWQASVDQALMRERAKDSWVIKYLQDEIRALRTQKSTEERCEAKAETRQGRESLLVISLRAEIELLKGCNRDNTSTRDPWQMPA